MSRRPIERYEWPLGAALLSLTLSILIRERKRSSMLSRARAPAQTAKLATASAAALVIVSGTSAFGRAPGLEFYQRGQFPEAYQQFQETLQSHPQSQAADKLEFDAGAAAYKMRDYNKALQAFSQALLTPDRGLQSKSHYNLGNTLYQHGEQQKNDDQKLSDWNNALQHYEETLKLEPDSQEAKENADYVRRKIEELKQRKQQQQEKKQQQQPGTKPSPPPEPSEAAKRAKAEADKAVRESKFRKALNIMADHLKVDATTSFYRDYIHRLQDINGIKRTDDSSP